MRAAQQVSPLVEQGRYEAARGRYLELIERLPPAERAANAALRAGFADAAGYRRYLASLHVNRALCDLRLRDFESAAGGYRRALEIAPDSVSARRGLALSLFRARRFDDAHRVFQELADGGSARGSDLLFLGRAARRSGRLRPAAWALPIAGARAAREAGVSGWGTALAARRELAALAVDRGRLEEGLARIRALTAVVPGDAEARYLETQILARLGRDQEARAARREFERVASSHALIQELLATPPFSDDEVRRAAHLYQALGLLDLAEVHFRRLLERHPDDGEVAVAIRKIRRRAHDSPLLGARGG